jgi:hypothetical protein
MFAAGDDNGSGVSADELTVFIIRLRYVALSFGLDKFLYLLGCSQRSKWESVPRYGEVCPAGPKYSQRYVAAPGGRRPRKPRPQPAPE